MKLAVFGALILLSCHVLAIETDENFLDNPSKFTAFESLLEKFKAILKTGNASLGIPPVDPFTADKLPIQFNKEKTKVDALLKKVNVQGMSEYTVNSADYQIISLKVELNLTWPLVVANAEYKLQANVNDFNIFGKGDVGLVARNFDFAGVITFNVKGKYLEVRCVQTKFFLKKMNIKITGLFDDEKLSELISTVLSDMLPQLIVDYQDAIAKKLNVIVTNVLNNFLSDKTLGDLLKWLS